MGPIGSHKYVNAVAYDMQLDNGGEGSPHVIVSMRVVDGPETGRNLTYRGYLTPCKPGKKMGAIDVTMQNLRALGWTGTKISKAMAEGLGTVKANVRLTVEEYEGKISEKVTGIYTPKVFGPKNPVDTDNIAAFDALFEDAAAGYEAVAVTEANKAPATLPPAVKYTPAPAKTAEPDPF
jgi:hypothetical protein